MRKSHSDHKDFVVEYHQENINNFPITEKTFQQFKEIFGYKAKTYENLMRALDNYTLEEIHKKNQEQWKISCLKRPDVRSIIIDKKWKILTLMNDTLLIGTNHIEKTSNNQRWTECIRISNSLDSTINKNICHDYCGHTWCAEKNAIDLATIIGLWDKLLWSTLVLFWHTEWPCTSCCTKLIEKDIRWVLIGTAPVHKWHNHYDQKYSKTWFKMLKNIRFSK